jgi:hypothetical protein
MAADIRQAFSSELFREAAARAARPIPTYIVHKYAALRKDWSRIPSKPNIRKISWAM